MKRLKIATFALALTALVASCCPCRKAANTSHSALLGTEWLLVQMGGRNITEAFGAEGCPRLVLSDDGNFGGYGGCNSMGGAYKMTPNASPSQKNTAGKITFGDAFSTKRMCPNDRLEMEYLKTLSACDAYAIEGSKLFLFHNSELTLVFEAQK